MAKKILNLASENNFQLVFPKIPTETVVDRELVLNIYETVFPGVSFETNESHWQGWVLPAVLSNMRFEEWTVSFDIDEIFDNWKRLFDWMWYINNNKDKAGETLKNYAIDATLFVYDNYGNIVIKGIFTSLFPRTLDGVNLSTREGEKYLTSKVIFDYIYFELEK